MSCGRPSQKLTKWARRKATTSMRMGAQDRFPQGDGAIELALGPGGQRGDVAALARGGAGGKRLRGARRLDGGRNGGLLEGHHGEIALHAMRKREVRIGFQQGGETGRRIGSLGEVAGDEMVVGSGRLGAGGRDGEAAGVEMHGVVPMRHFPYARPIRASWGMINSKPYACLCWSVTFRTSYWQLWTYVLHAEGSFVRGISPTNRRWRRRLP